ncbi:MAG: peptidase T [Oscillibacter sp.]|jgi:tripeptide aminopeptidase|nr:peptidase T [Oscillibacter sp.]
MENITRPYERLLRYTRYETASREGVEKSPSTDSQLVFARALAEELRAIGVGDAAVDENGYVYGSIPSNVPGWKGTTIALLAHMDVSAASPCENAHPRVEAYAGGDLPLGGGVVLRESDFPELSRYAGKSLVVTDGSTLLGADDKAGIAEIMTMAERLLRDDTLPRGDLRICFTPDEEIGSGAELLDLARLGADAAYTLDGEAFGGVEYETFNAADAKLRFFGVSVHPGSAKGVLRNAVLMAAEFIDALPRDQFPETTEGYEGYFFAEGLAGTVESAELHCLIRDHDAEKFAARKAFLQELAAKMNQKYGPGAVELTLTDSYYNMREKLLPAHQDLIDAAYAAVRAAGGQPFSLPVRGGTDGARLSFRGLPCPNLGTGGGNYHSRLEYACVEDMDRCVDMLVEIAAHYAKNQA